MRVSIRQKNLEITPALREYLETKIIKSVEKLLMGGEKAALPILDLEVARTTQHHRKGEIFRVQATLSWGGITLRAEHEDIDTRTACDEVEEELKREIKKQRTRAFSLLKRGARKVKKDLRFDPAARMYRKGRIRDEGN